MDLLIDNYQATPEERAVVKVLIEQACDPNERIIKLYWRLKKQLTILAEMKDAIPYPEEDFVEALYMAVQKTRQFPKVCSKWKKKDEGDCATKAQARTYFNNMCEVCDKQRDSLHDIGVANNVEMKEALAKLTADNVQIKLEMANQNAENN